MRITTTMMNSSMLQSLNKNLQNLDKYQKKIATGKEFSKPSDDPIGVSKSLTLNTTLSKLEQYKSNTEDALSWMEITETAVSNVEDIILRAKELTTQAANGTYSAEDRTSMKAEIDQLKEQLIQIANTTYMGKNIFSGYKTDQKLLDSNGNYIIDSTDEPKMYSVGVNENISINVLGYQIFGRTGETAPPYTTIDTVDVTAAGTGEKSQLIAVFEELSDALDVDDDARIGNSLDRLNNHLDNVLAAWTEIGAKVNRVELTVNRIADDVVGYTELLSKNEDADYAETIMQFQMYQNVYNASLSVTSSVIQKSLVDFMR
ncbi:MAG: flagellar hook-associated protein FlgL [Bacillota bacterium]